MDLIMSFEARLVIIVISSRRFCVEYLDCPGRTLADCGREGCLTYGLWSCLLSDFLGVSCRTTVPSDGLLSLLFTALLE
jgi:hypothetical protein